MVPKTKYERISVVLLIPATVLYSLAVVTHAWFELPGVSYGLFWAEFCNVLQCEIIPAFFTEEPVWYHILQVISILAWAGMSISLILLVSSTCDFHIPTTFNVRRQQAASVISLASVFAISLTLVLFYGKLDESSEIDTPQIHWSAVLAGISCLLELGAGLLLMQV